MYTVQVHATHIMYTFRIRKKWKVNLNEKNRRVDGDVTFHWNQRENEELVIRSVTAEYAYEQTNKHFISHKKIQDTRWDKVIQTTPTSYVHAKRLPCRKFDTWDSSRSGTRRAQEGTHLSYIYVYARTHILSFPINFEWVSSYGLGKAHPTIPFRSRLLFVYHCYHTLRMLFPPHWQEQHPHHTR